VIDRRLQARPVSSLPINDDQILRKVAGPKPLDLSP
jgi:hypothetical protein